MDYSAANQELWSFIIQLGLIAGAILLAQLLTSIVPASRATIAMLVFFILSCFYL